MKLIHFLTLILLAVLWAGCKKTEADTTRATGDSVPTQAQSRLRTMQLYLGPETLDAEIALTPMQQETGLMYRTNITDETAMLFVLPGVMLPPNGFWMTNCPISLSAAYIGPDGVIEEIHHLEKEDNVPVVATNNNIVYVLEVNDGWFTRHGVRSGMLIRTARGSLAQTFR